MGDYPNEDSTDATVHDGHSDPVGSVVSEDQDSIDAAPVEWQREPHEHLADEWKPEPVPEDTEEA